MVQLTGLGEPPAQDASGRWFTTSSVIPNESLKAGWRLFFGRMTEIVGVGLIKIPILGERHRAVAARPGLLSTHYACGHCLSCWWTRIS